MKIIMMKNNTSSEVIKYEFDRNKNNIFRDSFNSLINNIEIIDTKYNENEKNGKLSIENYIASVNTRKIEQLNDKTKNILNEINGKNKLNKLIKKKKLKKVNKSSKNNTMVNTLLLSSNNKISSKKKTKNNILNTENNKSENKSNFSKTLKGKKLRKNKMENKCISKEIIPFSINSNNSEKNKAKSEIKSDSNKINPLINSSNNISSNKNFKIIYQKFIMIKKILI